ncbi:MAG: hypothetical protein Q9Q40_14840 [Acidobacteriota bacterium]|nr:hypothetical protein [Acidobacteriota bacterium]MDQ7086870.1 hypothetical protein [Acidobacteriota bacterium]
MKKSPFWLRSLLWVLAVFLMLAAVVYQRTTGPTYPARGEFELAGEVYAYKLIRSDWSIKTNPAARVEIPDPGAQRLTRAELVYRRLRTDDPFTHLEMTPQSVDGKNLLVGELPAQPAAGKLEYHLELATVEGEAVRVPAQGEVIIRFKDHVPGWVLWPHVVMMFFSVLIGMRAGLGALFAPWRMRLWAWIALVGMTIGGMCLGPLVQKYAFGAYWTGFPFGGDWTDNKMLVMWLSWVVACAAIGFRPKKREFVSRGLVVAAGIAMTVAFLIPHSMGGSELDYSKVDQGVDPAHAIETGRP